MGGTNKCGAFPIPGLSAERVRALLGTPEPSAPIEEEPRDPFAPDAPYALLLGDQKTRCQNIEHDEALIALLGFNRLSTTEIGMVCEVSRECVRRRLVELGVERRKQGRRAAYPRATLRLDKSP